MISVASVKLSLVNRRLDVFAYINGRNAFIISMTDEVSFDFLSMSKSIRKLTDRNLHSW